MKTPAVDRAPGGAAQRTAEGWFAQGATAFAAADYEGAVAAFRRVLAILPEHVPSLCNLGLALDRLGRPVESIDPLARAVRSKPGDVHLLCAFGMVLLNARRPADALAVLDRAIGLRPDVATAHDARGTALRELGRAGEAVHAFARAVALQPDFADALVNLGAALLVTGSPALAHEHLSRALALRPADPVAWTYAGKALVDLERPEPALQAFARALELAPGDPIVTYQLAGCLRRAGRVPASLEHYRSACAAAPDNLTWLGEYLYTRLQICDWSGFAEDSRRVLEFAARGGRTQPMLVMSLTDDPGLLRACAAEFAPPPAPAVPRAPRAPRARAPGEPLRIAYLSGDFFTHATSFLAAGFFELHDRTRFAVVGVSYGPDDRSPLRRRIAAGFDEFLDVRMRTDEQVADLLRRRSIDVAVDLKGLTWGSRLGILASRPAAVQATYLGFPGTTAARCIDYAIADAVVAPPEIRAHFTEALVLLPHCYQVNDRQRGLAPPPSRESAGLPEGAFVFCSFNGAWKITPAVFDTWMRLLAAVPGSVLWLLELSGGAAEHLRREAATRGIDPARLVFARPLDNARHVARYALADLFLDTWHCGAHTTASDALWAGLPVLTIAGRSFAARVATSLLLACGLPELVTSGVPEYEAAAIALARDPARLRALRERLAVPRTRLPPFATERFTRNFERALETMWERHVAGRAPETFAVPDVGPQPGDERFVPQFDLAGARA